MLLQINVGELNVDGGHDLQHITNGFFNLVNNDVLQYIFSVVFWVVLFFLVYFVLAVLLLWLEVVSVEIKNMNIWVWLLNKFDCYFQWALGLKLNLVFRNVRINYLHSKYLCAFNLHRNILFLVFNKQSTKKFLLY